MGIVISVNSVKVGKCKSKGDTLQWFCKEDFNMKSGFVWNPMVYLSYCVLEHHAPKGISLWAYKMYISNLFDFDTVFVIHFSWTSFEDAVTVKTIVKKSPKFLLSSVLYYKLLLYNICLIICDLGGFRKYHQPLFCSPV